MKIINNLWCGETQTSMEKTKKSFTLLQFLVESYGNIGLEKNPGHSVKTNTLRNIINSEKHAGVSKETKFHRRWWSHTPDNPNGLHLDVEGEKSWSHCRLYLFGFKRFWWRSSDRYMCEHILFISIKEIGQKISRKLLLDITVAWFNIFKVEWSMYIKLPQGQICTYQRIHQIYIKEYKRSPSQS